MEPEDRQHARILRSRAAIIAFALVAGLFGYGFRIVRVQGDSMFPTYRNGQWLLVRRLNWPSPPLRYGDVVVFRLDTDLLVKRVAATADQPVPDAGHLFELRRLRGSDRWKAVRVTSPPRVVPAKEFYVLGDNPAVSEDSRDFGLVPLAALTGRVIRWNEPGRAPSQEERQALLVTTRLSNSQVSDSGFRRIDSLEE